MFGELVQARGSGCRPHLRAAGVLGPEGQQPLHGAGYCSTRQQTAVCPSLHITCHPLLFRSQNAQKIKEGEGRWGCYLGPGAGLAGRLSPPWVSCPLLTDPGSTLSGLTL